MSIASDAPGPGVNPLSLEQASRALLLGELLLFPTETFYAIGCNALNPDAVARIFSVKNRPLGMPLPVVLGDRQQIGRVAEHVSPLMSRLMDVFWPGPLSLVLPARPDVPELITANAGRVAVRVSPHPAVSDLCLASGLVLVASSANISGFPPVVRQEVLDARLMAAVAGVYDRPPQPAGGLPSTVADVVQRRGKGLVRVLRPGAVREKAIMEAGFSLEDRSASSR